MTRAEFWKLIEKSKSKSEDNDEQVEILRKSLAKLPAKEIVEFNKIMDKLMAISYRWDLWAAAYIINGGCSDDGFHYFRGWLIGQGQRVFEAALKDPETLVKVANDEAEENENELLLYVALEAYEEKTGKQMQRGKWPLPDEPAGARWEEKDGVLEEMYPKLWAKFGA